MLAVGVEVKADMVVIGSAIETDTIVMQSGTVGNRAVDGEKTSAEDEFLTGKRRFKHERFWFKHQGQSNAIERIVESTFLKMGWMVWRTIYHPGEHIQFAFGRGLYIATVVRDIDGCYLCETITRECQ